MATEQKLCAVCDQPVKTSKPWCPVCESCEPIWHICFTSVEDGIRAAKNSDLETLHKALALETRKPWSRKTLRMAIAREISKRLNTQTKTTES